MAYPSKWDKLDSHSSYLCMYPPTTRCSDCTYVDAAPWHSCSTADLPTSARLLAGNLLNKSRSPTSSIRTSNRTKNRPTCIIDLELGSKGTPIHCYPCTMNTTCFVPFQKPLQRTPCFGRAAHRRRPGSAQPSPPGRARA